jgi:hypothetical protein
MARREALQAFHEQLLEHERQHPDQYPAFLVGVMVDPESGQIWCCEHVLVSQEILDEVYRAIKRDNAVEESRSERWPTDNTMLAATISANVIKD